MLPSIPAFPTHPPDFRLDSKLAKLWYALLNDDGDVLICFRSQIDGCIYTVIDQKQITLRYGIARISFKLRPPTEGYTNVIVETQSAHEIDLPFTIAGAIMVGEVPCPLWCPEYHDRPQ